MPLSRRKHQGIEWVHPARRIDKYAPQMLKVGVLALRTFEWAAPEISSSSIGIGVGKILGETVLRLVVQ